MTKINNLKFFEKRTARRARTSHSLPIFSAVSIVPGFLLSACQVAKVGAADGQGIESLPRYETNEDEGTMLRYSEAEVADIAPKGLIWSPFILPFKSGAILEEKDFFLGEGLFSGKHFSPAPPSGQCADLSDEIPDSVTLKTETLTQEVTLILDAIEQKGKTGTLYFVADAERGGLITHGNFDQNGVSKCVLPRKSLIVSTGFGGARLETILPKNQTELKVALEPRGQLQYDGSSRAMAGKILRLGRVINQAKEDLSFRISERFAHDLFQRVDSPSKNFGAQEFFHTSLLLSDASFTVSLEPAKYIAVIIGSSTDAICQKEFEIKPGETFKIDCSPASFAKKSFFTDKKPGKETILDTSFEFDATFYPQRITRSANFRKWLKLRGTDFFLTDNTDDSSGRDKTKRPIDDEKKRYFLNPVEGSQSLRLGKKSNFGPYLGNFADLSAGNFFSNFGDSTRIASGLANFTADSFSKAFYERTGTGKVPFGGVSEKAIVTGATPMLFLRNSQFHLRADFNLKIAMQWQRTAH